MPVLSEHSMQNGQGAHYKLDNIDTNVNVMTPERCASRVDNRRDSRNEVKCQQSVFELETEN